MSRRFFTVLGSFLVVFTAATAGTRETNSVWIRGVYTANSPRPVATTSTEAWRQASILSENLPRSFVLVGYGQSMQPLYAPGTVMVLQQKPYKDLKRGQTVLYRNKANKTVAHVLVTKARDGWRVQGLNNRIHDMEPVNAENLVGIVVAAFRPVTSARRVMVASLR